MDLNAYQTFLQKQMSFFFKFPIEQGFALVYFDDTLLLSNSQEHIFQPKYTTYPQISCREFIFKLLKVNLSYFGKENPEIALTSDTYLTIPKTKHLFLITVDASLIGSGAVLFQFNAERKGKYISYTLRKFNLQEQIHSTLDREIRSLVHALQVFDFLII